MNTPLPPSVGYLNAYDIDPEKYRPETIVATTAMRKVISHDTAKALEATGSVGRID